jgi:demethylmenaquinone methyltransferase/2-methoxy-6-polyprenyl-1,4-benzoquinol methylase
VANPLREPLLRSIIRALGLPPGSRGLDAGCGIGLQTPLLLEAVGRSGHVTGLDLLPELLEYGREAIDKRGLSEGISFREGDVSHLPFADDQFDWVWSADCIGYPAGALTPVLAELKRVVRPGGTVAILGWTSQQFLPGYSLLEARLTGTCSGYIPFLRGKSPELSFMQAMRWFRQAGLGDIRAQTFVWDVQAPLSADLRTALTSLLAMLWGMPQPEVSDADWKEYLRLCQSASMDFILDVADYYGFFTYSLFRGTVPPS